MNIIGWIILGGLAGWIASRLTGNSEGCVMGIVIGICGAFVGGAIFSALGLASWTGLDLRSLLVAVVGAVIIILVVRAFRKRG